MRILAEILLVAILLGGAVVFFRAIWKMIDKADEKKDLPKKGGK